MAELRPYPFSALVARLLDELGDSDTVFDLPKRSFFLGDPERDLSVSIHGRRASSPLGPAAGPHTQMAQNLVLAWLGGCRVMELKTVQVNDRLEIPRPCIDMQTIGYNVEWSQELRLQESLEEYVKGAMLIQIACASGALDLVPGFDDTVYDMSVGYDLAGLQSPSVGRFLEQMADCTAIVDRLRGEIPSQFAEFRDLAFPTRLSETLTLSTFHGCPPTQIESMLEYLMREHELDCTVKLNPTLLGAEAVREILADLGYADIRVPDSAFLKDTTWQQAVDFCGRLGDLAAELGRSFGVKFTNTLLVENHRSFFPVSEEFMYLSGQPLHVIAMQLVARFRKTFGNRFPVSFSAGIDRGNFADAVAIGLAPITVCSDLLRPGGYARASTYLTQLVRRMEAVGATGIDEFILLTDHSTSDINLAIGTNTERYAKKVRFDPRYTQKKNAKVPKKIGSSLSLLDCITCNKCVPVCPNDANFSFVLPAVEQDIIKGKLTNGTWQWRTDGTLTVRQKAQYGNFADFCNECGNCDVFCPEDGGPYIVKSRFFGSFAEWRRHGHLDGFFFEPMTEDGTCQSYARFDGKEFFVRTRDAQVSYRGDGFQVAFDSQDPKGTVGGQATTEVDLTYYYLVVWIRKAVLLSDVHNYLRYATYPSVKNS